MLRTNILSGLPVMRRWSTRQRDVRDRYYNYIGDNITNGWLLLGDNAYNDGTETEYTNNFFQIYQDNIMRKTPLWPATGNHDYDDLVARPARS